MKTLNEKNYNILLPFLYSFLLLFIFGCSKKNHNLVQYVDPFIGTDSAGHTFPGSCLPFSMVQLSPDNGYQGVKAYSYSENNIIGFSHTHLSGTGSGTKTYYNNILLMPTVGKLETMPGVKKELNFLARESMKEKGILFNENQEKYNELFNKERLKILLDNNLEEEGYRTSDTFSGYEAKYNHNQEQAKPGYYSVNLKKYKIKAELTSTMRAGFHRYTFPKSDSAHIIIDVTNSLTPNRNADVKIINNYQISGSVTGDMEGAYNRPLTCYFFAEFNKPFKSSGVWHDEIVKNSLNEMAGNSGIGAYANFSTDNNEQILVKVGISFTSIEGARKNLEHEIPHWDFELIQNNASNIWNKKLSKISVSGGTAKQKKIFYTSLYHSLMFPRTFSDVDGSYYSKYKDRIIKSENSPYYVDFSLWDTYRAQHPLLAYLEPDRQNEMINTLLSMYKQGGRLPLFVSYKNYFMKVMIGDHSTSVIVDSYMKGIRNYNIELAYEAMRKNAMKPGDLANSRTGLQEYIDLGYAPADKVRESVSVTLEYTYDDWCLAQMANSLGKKDDYNLFSKRAKYYKNLYDEETKLFRPKKADGSWLKHCSEYPDIIYTPTNQYYSCFDPLWVGVSPSRHYTESNAWQYFWHVPHDVNGLVNVVGGNKIFINKLDSLFTMTPYESGPQYSPMRSKIGQYVHGNEPVHHVAYLYNYVKQPWKTQQRVVQIMNEMYTDTPDGLCGNDDMGQMSAWYIFSAMGFYPVAPGQNVYAIGTPLFDEITLNLPEFYNNSKFTVIAENVSKENYYIQSATLNGNNYNKTWITHGDIVKGGTLIFKMGNKPNKNWGSSKNSVPLSMK